TLVLGGTRSGKSRYAEQLAAQGGGEVVYIATAEARDAEMAERIAHHRASRPAPWTTVEETLHLADAIERHARPGRVVLVDCLTLWLSNLIFSAGDLPDTGRIALPALFLEQRQRLLDGLARAGGDVVLVSNEVGLGIVPMGAVTRCFADEAGRLNQAVAALATRVVFVAAGLPLALKGAPC
ncbi:MAG: bifunctional adenosylcobinamide kinase/adenosylcobinamide-phosphate guanylyltransferase, partial [Gammaproteobacteria bacterium]